MTGALALKGLTVAVFTTGHDAIDARIYGREAVSLQALGAEVFVVGKLERGAPGGVPVLVVSAPRSRLSRFALQSLKVLWAARQTKPDIVHLHDPDLLLALPAIRACYPGTKVVYDVHEDVSNMLMVRDWLPDTAKPATRAIVYHTEQILARLVDGIVSVTPQLTAHFPEHPRVTAYNFPARAFYEATGRLIRPASERQYDLVHLGTLNRKRADFLAQTISAIESRWPQTRSLIIGAERAIADIVRRRVSTSCDILDVVPHSDIPRLLTSAKVGIDVHPWMAPHLALALPVKVCEYMAAGCSVVTSRFPVLDEILDKGFVTPGAMRIVESEDPQEYAAAVIEQLEVSSAGTPLGESLRRFAEENMVWEHEAMKIGELYRRLMGTKCVA